MHPLRRFGLAHAQQASVAQGRGMLLAVDQNTQETIFRSRQGTVRIGRVASRLPAPPMQGPCDHVGQERCLKGKQSCSDTLGPLSVTAPLAPTPLSQSITL